MLSHYAMMYMEVFPPQYNFPDTFLGREQLHGLTVASIAISNYRASNFSGSSKEASEKFNFEENKANNFHTTQTKRVGELEDEKRYWNVTFRRSKSQVLWQSVRTEWFLIKHFHPDARFIRMNWQSLEGEFVEPDGNFCRKASRKSSRLSRPLPPA